MRAKLMNAVDEAGRGHHLEQMAEIRALRLEVAALGARLDATADRLLSAIRDVEIRDRRDVFAAGERAAVAGAARFAALHMPTVPTFGHPHETLRHALGFAPAEGMALEFGVWRGTTLRIIAEARGGRDVHGFDSFEGLPEDWRSGFPQGTFDDVEGIPVVEGAELHKGLFADTLPGFLRDHPGPVTFLHIDCDLYSSTVTVLDQVGPRLCPGAVVVFDEFFNYPGWEGHEARAWQEYVDRTGTTFEYVGYTRDNEQVIIKITGVRGH